MTYPLGRIPLNVDTLLHLCQGDIPLAQQTLARYRESLDQEKAALEQAYQSSDWQTLAYRAHRLRSGSRYVGAEQIAVATETLEEVSQAKALASLDHAWLAFCIAVQQFTEQTPQTLILR